MALADPLSVTIDKEAIQLSRIATGDTSGKFQSNDKSVTLLVRPRTTAAGRRANVIQLRKKKVTTDPLVSTTNVEVEASVAVTVNLPASGFTSTDVANLYAALAGLLTGSSNAVLNKIVNGES